MLRRECAALKRDGSTKLSALTAYRDALRLALSSFVLLRIRCWMLAVGCGDLYPPVATSTYSLTKIRFSMDPSRRRSIGDRSSSKRCGSRSHSFSTASSRSQAERARRISKRKAIRFSMSRPVGGMRPDMMFSTRDSSASSNPSSHAASRNSRFHAVNRCLMNFTGPTTRSCCREEILKVGFIALLRSRSPFSGIIFRRFPR